MRGRIILFLAACVAAGPASWSPSAGAAPRALQPPDSRCAKVDVLTPEEKAAGWQLLFNGTDSSGWHGYNKQDTKAWIVEDCALKTTGTEGNYGSDKRADLVTDREFTDFELSLEWKASKGGNSGVMYGVVEDPKYDAPWKTGPEYQLLDDEGFPRPVSPEQKAGANYAMHPPGAQRTLRPAGEWNTTRIVVHGAHVEHWLNGSKVLEFERWSPEWNALRDSGKWKDAPDYGTAKTGRIALQDHGSIFWFRNIKIRPIGG